MSYAAGRFWIDVSREGSLQHTNVHGCYIKYRNGWNDSCEIEQFPLSIDEMRDLQYIIGRAIQDAERDRELNAKRMGYA